METPTNDFLEHYGIKGMRWGVRRSDAQLSKATKKLNTPDAEARAKTRRKVFIGAAVTAGVLATAAAAYTVYDQKQLSKVKDTVRISELSYKRAMDTPALNRTIQKGAAFTRKGFDAWGNDFRTYVVEGGETISRIDAYGPKTFKFKATKDVRIAGLDFQTKLLSSNIGKELSDSVVKANSPYSLSGRKFIKGLSGESFSKLTLENLRRSAYGGLDGDKASINLSKEYIDILKSFGYSGVNDINLPDIDARVLFDKDAFKLV